MEIIDSAGWGWLSPVLVLLVNDYLAYYIFHKKILINFFGVVFCLALPKKLQF